MRSEGGFLSHVMRGLPWMAGLVFVVVLAAFGMQLVLLQQKIEAQDQRLAQTHEWQIVFTQEREALRQHWKKHRDRQQGQIAELKNDLKKLNGLNTDNWRLLESVHLVGMAMERLYTVFDVPTALRQLDAARQRLQVIPEADVQKLSLELERYQTLLAREEPFSWEHRWRQLMALQQHIEVLSWNTQPLEADANTPELTQGGLHTQDKLKVMWGELKQFLTLKKIDQVVDHLPWLQADQLELLRERMQWMVLQAQWSLLAKEEGNYRESLHTLEQLVHRYARTELPTTQDLLRQVRLLQHRSVRPELPDPVNLISHLEAVLLTRGFETFGHTWAHDLNQGS